MKTNPAALIGEPIVEHVTLTGGPRHGMNVVVYRDQTMHLEIIPTTNGALQHAVYKRRPSGRWEYIGMRYGY